MQRQWIGKNVDLGSLSEAVEAFFKDRGFKTKAERSGDKYIVFWAFPRARDVGRALRVIVYGSPDDLWIDFPGSENAHRSILQGFALTLFGGGALILRGLRMKEALEKIEREFWVSIEDAVLRLVNSSRVQ